MSFIGNILVFNSGSSSLKFQLFEVERDTPASLLRGAVRDIGDESICDWDYLGHREREPCSATDHAMAARRVLDLLKRLDGADQSLDKTVASVGHRIVHGGDSFLDPTLLTDHSLAELDALNRLAPLHNPPALAVVRTCRERLPDVPMVAVFDTAFFRRLPEHVRAYALPAEWTEGSQPIRRYGFHGLAHRYMAERYLSLRDADATPCKVITLQLGHGCSATAVRDGIALETSMGFTPMEGLVMATRPGDVDPGVVLHLLERGAVTTRSLNEGMNHRAGLLGLSGATSDMRELLALQSRGHDGARLAVEAFCHRARKYIGAYLAVLGGAEAILFGGGIGEHAPAIRKRICAGFAWCGLELDARANEDAVGTEARISKADSSLAAYVIPVDEESLIARDTVRCVGTVAA